MSLPCRGWPAWLGSDFRIGVVREEGCGWKTLGRECFLSHSVAAGSLFKYVQALFYGALHRSGGNCLVPYHAWNLAYVCGIDDCVHAKRYIAVATWPGNRGLFNEKPRLG